MTSPATTAAIQQAALIASAVAAALATNPTGGLNAESAAAVLGSVVTAAGPLLPPNASLAIGLASIALNAIHSAVITGEGLTPEQRAALLSADDAAIAADNAARAAAGVAVAAAAAAAPKKA